MRLFVFIILLLAYQLKTITIFTAFKRNNEFEIGDKNKLPEFNTLYNVDSAFFKTNRIVKLKSLYKPGDERGGLFYWDAQSNAKTVDGMVLKCNKLITGRLKRLYDGKNLNVEWFGVKGDGTTDNTVNLQKAVNFCNNKTLAFQKNKVYRFNSVVLPVTIKLDGNGCFVMHYLPGFYSLTPLFYIRPGSLNFSDSIYSNKIVSPPENKSTALYSKNIEVSGFIYDGEYLDGQFIQTLLNNFTGLNGLNIHDNEFINFSGNALWIKASNNLTSNSASILNTIIRNNIFKNGGAFIHVSSLENYEVGATTIHLQTLDSSKLSDRVIVNRYIQFASIETKPVSKGGYLEGSTTYAASNSIYKVIDLKKDLNDSTKGTITIASGIYSKSSGWVADKNNRGLKAPIIKNAWVLPPYYYEFPLLTNYPQFSAVQGSNKFTRAVLSVTEDNYAKNLTIGSKFYINNIQGIYTITSVDSNAVYTDIPATSSSVASLIYPLGNLGYCIHLNGDCRNTLVEGNTFDGASRGIEFHGMTGKGLYSDDIPSSITASDNIFKYCWMANEYFSLSSIDDPFSLQITSIRSGDSLLNITSPSHYVYYYKDIDNDGIKDNVIASSITKYENVTAGNSLAEGDIILLKGERGLYRIVSIPSDWPKSSNIIVRRFDANKRKDLSGGFYSSRIPIGYSRLYSKGLGSIECVGTAVLKNNKMFWGLRASGGSYFASVRVNDLTISNNEIHDCEATIFEVTANHLIFNENHVYDQVWQGEKMIPGMPNWTNGSGYKTAGALFGGLNASDITMKENIFNFLQPDNLNYSSYTSGISFYSRSPLLGNYSRFIFDNNTVEGITGKMFAASSNAFEKVDSTNFPVSGWDTVEIKENTFNLYKGISTLSFGVLLGSENYITDNTFNFKGSNTNIIKMFYKPYPNPLLFPPGSFTIKIKNNAFLNNKVPVM